MSADRSGQSDETARRLRPAEERDLRAAFERDRRAGEWNSLPAAIERLLTADRDFHLEMHQAFRPEAVAEVAVHLSEEADWEAIAAWCGGSLGSTQDPSGEYAGYIDIPGVGCAGESCWITLAHDGTFRIRAEVAAPDRLTRPGVEADRG